MRWKKVKLHLLAFFIILTFLVSPLLVFQFTVKAEEEPFEGWLNRYNYQSGNTITFNLGPQVFWNGSWQTLRFEDRYETDGYYLIENAHITAYICDWYTVFYDPDNSYVCVDDERWIVQVYNPTVEDWREVDLYSPILTYSNNATHLTVTRTFDCPEGLFNVTYVLWQGSLLKHDVAFTNRMEEQQTFHVIYKLTGIHHNKIKCEDETFTVTDEKHKVTPWFRCGEDDASLMFSEYLDVLGTYNETGQWNSDKLKDIVFNTYSSGSKADIIIGNYTLGQDESLQIDPTTTTFTLTVDTDDGRVYATGSDYQTLHDQEGGFLASTTLITFGQRELVAVITYRIHRAFLRFNTDSLPDDATITSAKLCLYGKNDYSTDDFTIRIQNWTEASDGITTDDYNGFDGTNYDDGNFNTASFSTSAYNNITISNFAIINKLGNTTLCMRSGEDVDSSAPSDDTDEYVEVEDAGDTYKPKLEVTYTAESTVTLNSPADSSTIEASATVNFNYTPEFKAGETIQNSSLYLNLSGTWQSAQGNTTAVIDDAENTITYTFSNDGVYIWNVGVFNSTAEIFASSNWTVTIETFENIVDNNSSDEDSSADKGTHSDFSAEQDCANSNYDTLTEADQAPVEDNSENFADNNSSDVDSYEEGTHSNFTAQQYCDSFYDTLSEENAGSEAGSDILYVSGFSSVNEQWDETGDSPWLNDNTASYISTLTDEEWHEEFTFADHSGSESITSVYLYVEINGPSARNDFVVIDLHDGTDWTNIANQDPDGDAYVWYSFDVGATLDSWTKINAAKLRVQYQRSGTPSTETVYVRRSYINATHGASTNYELDLEIQWTTADYDEANEYLCIKTGSTNWGDEDIKVDVRDGAEWKTLISDLTANSWNNVSLGGNLTSATLTIRFKGGSESSDTNQDQWDIECSLIHVWSVGVNYNLDLEIQWIDANCSRTNEYLCIKTGSFGGSEDLQVKARNGGSWNWVMNLTAGQWNNVSVSSYLTGSEFTVQFLGGTETGDSSQDTWQIDCSLIHTWEVAGETYEVDLSQSVTISYSETEKWTASQDLTFNPNIGLTKTLGWITSLSISWTSTVAYTEQAVATFPITLSVTTDVEYSQQHVWTSKVSVDYSPNVDYTKQVEWTAGISVSFNPNVDYVKEVNWQSSLSFSWQPNVDYQESEKWTAKIPSAWTSTIGFTPIQTWNSAVQVDFSPNTQFSKTVDWNTGLLLTWHPSIGYSETSAWGSTIPLSWNPNVDLQKQLAWQSMIAVDYTPSVAYSTGMTWETTVAMTLQPTFAFTLDIVHIIGGQLYQIVLDFASSIGLVTDAIWTSTITVDYTTQIGYTKTTEWAGRLSLVFSPNLDYAMETLWSSKVSVSLNPNVDYLKETVWNIRVSVDWTPDITVEKLTLWNGKIAVAFNPNVDWQKQLATDWHIPFSLHPNVEYTKQETWTGTIPIDLLPSIGYGKTETWQATVSFLYSPSLSYVKAVDWSTASVLNWNPTVEYAKQVGWISNIPLTWASIVGYEKAEQWNSKLQITFTPNAQYTTDVDWQTGIAVTWSPNVGYTKQTEWTNQLPLSLTPNVDYSKEEQWAANVPVGWNPTLLYQKQIGWQTSLNIDYQPNLDYSLVPEWTALVTVNFEPSFTWLLDVVHTIGEDFYQVVLDLVTSIQWIVDLDWTAVLPVSFQPSVGLDKLETWQTSVVFDYSPTVSYVKTVDWDSGLLLTWNPNVDYSKQIGWMGKVPLSWSGNVAYQKAELWNSKLQVDFTSNVDYSKILDWDTSLSLAWNPNIDYLKQVDWTVKLPSTYSVNVDYSKLEQWQSVLAVDFTPNTEYGLDETWQANVVASFQSSFTWLVEVKHFLEGFYYVFLGFEPNIQFIPDLNWAANILLTFNPDVGYTVGFAPPIVVDTSTIGLAIVALGIALCVFVLAVKRYKEGEEYL